MLGKTQGPTEVSPNMSIFERLLEETPFSRLELFKLIRTAPHRYKVFSVPKRSSNGSRVIAQPTPELKLIQRWVVENVLVNYPIHDAAMAYRPGLGIKQNAMRHVKHRLLLKMDFKDFFPSILAEHFNLHTIRYAPEYVVDIDDLSKILFRRPRGSDRLELSIGAPSSPALSNSIVYDFDVGVAAYALQHNVIYTRYADDLIFSTNEQGVLADLYAQVIKLCRANVYPTLTLNYEKTIFASKKGNRTVTGLVLTNDGVVSIGHEKKRMLRVLIHRYEHGKLLPDEIEKLRGYLAFICDVEPVLFEKLKRRANSPLAIALFGP
jgi:RNA-directed DNA polymerase